MTEGIFWFAMIILAMICSGVIIKGRRKIPPNKVKKILRMKKRREVGYE